jgi:radical SAM protein with 4Fe4S-binding SPASM domain
MNKNFEEIVRYTKNIGIRNLELTTNGNLIDKNISKFISKNFSTVNISLHGSNPEFHEEMTRVKGSFKKGLNGYGLLLRGGLTPKINYSVANFNKLDVYYALFLSKDIGNHGIKFSLIKSYGRGKKLERINQLEITLLRNMISVESKKNGIKVERSELFPEGYLNQIETTKFYGCDGLRSKAYISKEGLVFPCSLYMKPVGNLYLNNLKKIWEAESSSQFRNLNLDGNKNCSQDCGGECKIKNI